MPKPPEKEDKGMTWPNWPLKLRTSSSQEEGCDRDWSVSTKSIEADENGNVSKINLVRLDAKMQEISGSEFELKADLVLLAMGFLHPVQEGMLKELGLDLDQRSNVKADTNNYQTSIEKVFAAGDNR